MYSGVPGTTTGLYTLSVTLATSTPLMPDLTGSSFRTGVDMAAAGDTIPVSFTVQNRGGADPGDFEVQVLLSDSNIFPSSSRGPGDVHEVGAGDGRDGPGLLVAGRLQRDVAVGPAVRPSLRRPANRGGPLVPEAGVYDKSSVHRGSDWEPLTVVTRATAGATDLSGLTAVCTRKSPGR